MASQDKRYKFGEKKRGTSQQGSSTNGTMKQLSQSQWANRTGAMSTNHADNEGATQDQINIPGSLSILFLTGTPAALLDWFNIIPASSYCYYEAISQLANAIQGTNGQEQQFLLRGSYGPVLKVAYYKHDHIELPNFHLGMWIRCVGSRLNTTTLRAFSIREATPGEVSSLPRMTYLSEEALKNKY